MHDRLRAAIRHYPRLHTVAQRIRATLASGSVDTSSNGQSQTSTTPNAAPAPAPHRVQVRLPRPAGDEQAEENQYLHFTAPPTLLIPRKLEREGLAGYEPESLACFLATLEHAPEGSVLDIGANVGVYTALASATSQRQVYGFEPAPDLASVLRRVAADNGLAFGVEECALSDRAGSATLYLSDRSDTSNSLAQGFRRSSRQVEVPLRTLDSWCAGTTTVPAIVKIDTEATEPDVIRGGLECLAEHRPWIFCEVLHGRVEQPLAELLEPLGYSWYHLAGEPPYEPRTEIVGDSTYRHLMWLFAPQPPDDTYWKSVQTWQDALASCVAHPMSDNIADQ